MIFRLLGMLIWGTTKFTVKHVVVPIAISAIIAAVIDAALEHNEANQAAAVDGMIRPEP